MTSREGLDLSAKFLLVAEGPRFFTVVALVRDSLREIHQPVLDAMLASLRTFAPEPTPTATAATATPTATMAVVREEPVARPAATPAQFTATPIPARPTATATRAPQSTGPSGQVVRAVPRVNAICGVAHRCASPASAHIQTGGIEEHMFVFEDGSPMAPELAEYWEMDEGGTRWTIALRRGIRWQPPHGWEKFAEDFGELTARDVALWLKASNAASNPASSHPNAGDFAAVIREATAIDRYTLAIQLVSPTFFCLPLSQSGCLGAARGPEFVRGVDMMGTEWARKNAVGTGPFVQDDCVQGDRCTVRALREHWRKVPEIASFTILQVPEQQTRRAMLRVGRADMADIDFKLVPEFLDQGFQYLETMQGAFVGQSIIYSGNLWESVQARTDEPLGPWAGPAYDRDYAWIGHPWQELNPGTVRYIDNDNPEGMTDMERARLVRLALGTAIDRNKINEVLLGGLGTPIYFEYMGPEYPGWDPDRLTGCWTFEGEKSACSGTRQDVRYELEDGNLAKAGELLDATGFPLVGGRRAIEGLALQSYAAEAGEVSLDVADLIGSTWGRLGITVERVVEDYGGTILPRMRKREQFLPILKNGDVHGNVFPRDWPYPAADSSITRPAWGVGFEATYLARQHFTIRGSSERVLREQEHMNTADYILYWQLYNGVFQIPKGVVATGRIMSWVGRQQHYSNVSSNPEFIVLAE